MSLKMKMSGNKMVPPVMVRGPKRISFTAVMLESSKVAQNSPVITLNSFRFCSFGCVVFCCGVSMPLNDSLFGILIGLMHTERITFSIHKISLPGNTGKRELGHCDKASGFFDLFCDLAKIFDLHRADVCVGILLFGRRFGRERQ